MFRRQCFLLARPFGPLSIKSNHMMDNVPNRTEKAMAEMMHGRPEFASMRRTYARPMKQSKIRAIPRDLGTVPRDHAIRLLFFNQPCTVETLWQLAKSDDSCPFDSKKHLKSVLTIARMQNWIVYEKNQTNNIFYCSVHPGKAKEAQELLYAQRSQFEARERQAAKQKVEDARVAKVLRGEALDAAIQQMQQQLMTAVVKLQEHNPDLIQQLSCVAEDGAVNFHWYDPDRAAGAAAPASSEDGKAEA